MGQIIYYINQLCTSSFPIWWDKTEYKSSDQLREMLVVPVINVYGFPILTFSGLTCHHEKTEVGVFWLHWVVMIVMRPSMEVASKRFSSGGKNAGVVLGVMSYNEDLSMHLFLLVWITEDEFLVRVTKWL